MVAMSGSRPSDCQENHSPVRPMPGLDVVEDQQRPGLVAEPPDRLEIVGIQRDHAALPLDRLEHHRGGVGVDHRFQGIQIVGLDLVEAGRKRSERCLLGGLAGGRQGCQGAAVKGIEQRNDLVAIGPSHGLPVAPGELDGSLVGGGPVVAEEDPVQPRQRSSAARPATTIGSVK